MRLRLLLPASLALIILAGARREPSVAPAALPVRWSEGTLHGFLELHTKDGDVLAHGDLLQVPRDSDIESRLVFEFADSSVFRETVTFTQHGVFLMESYHLEQRGKAFPQDLEVTLARSGEYVVKTKSHEDGAEQEHKGKLDDMPEDVYNGMIPVIGKNIPLKEGRTVHIVAFTPKPLVLPLAITPSGTDPVGWGGGGRQETATRFTLKPKLNLLQRIGAKLKGQSPPDSYIWIVTSEVPAFVRFQGPLYSGPIWRIDLAGPRWPK
ncbi:MAG TPA: hypothetical protein VN803_06090 [Gemmatimonadales bacterium]|nr:hypothetical protein [Gemmatimonadales bacterium]